MNAGGERRRENGCGQSSHGMGHPIGRSSTLSLELPELDGEAVVAIAEPVMGFQIDAVAHRVHRAITHGHVQDAGVALPKLFQSDMGWSRFGPAHSNVPCPNRNRCSTVCCCRRPCS